MILLHGRYFDGRTSGERPATLAVTPAGTATLRLPDGERHFRAGEVRIGERVGNTPRRVTFPGGEQFETDDNDAVDRILSATDQQRLARWVHRLESRWTTVAMAVVVLAVAVTSLVLYGIPAAARTAAFALPADTSRAIGQGALELMDKALFAPSQVDDATRERVQRLFDDVARQDTTLALRLEFRRGRRVGANAFALPSGVVVITDEMIKLSRHDHELVAVFAHEAGHVAQRHALRRALQGSAVALVTLMISGDLSSTATLVAALPTVLAESKYSRAFENEADDHAQDYLARQGIDLAHFGNLMRRLEKSHQGSVQLPEWLSTHPATEERIRRFEGAENRTGQ
jgi:predicted Zn-dependent protease